MFCFTDGTSVKADVVLVANGVKSSVRGMVMDTVKVSEDTENSGGSGIAVKGISYSNTACFRGLVRHEHAKELGIDVSMWNYPTIGISKDKVS